MSSPCPKHAARAYLFNPRSLLADVSIWAISPLGVPVRHVICGFLFFSSWICCSPIFQNYPQTHRWEVFLVFGNISSFTTPSPGQVSVHNSFVSFFIFYILSYLLSKRMGCLSGCLVSSASIQKLFCGICSSFKWSFSEFVGKKVVSPSYFSTILGPSRPCNFPNKNTGVGCHFLLQGIFLTQGSNPHLLHGRCILYHWVT